MLAPWTAGKLYTCGGYGGERASLLCIDADTWDLHRVPTSGPGPLSHDSHSIAVHGAPLVPAAAVPVHRLGSKPALFS